LPVDSDQFRNLEWSPSEVSDTSHHSRLVQLFLAIEQSPFIQNNSIFSIWQTGQTTRIIRALANQFASTFYTDPKSGLPIVANYSDGRNGWYRLNERNSDGTLVFGHYPGNFTNQLHQFGYWMNYSTGYALDESFLAILDAIEQKLAGTANDKINEYVEWYYQRPQYPFTLPGTPTPLAPNLNDPRTLVGIYSGMAFADRYATATPTITATPTSTPTGTPTAVITVTATPTPTSTPSPIPTFTSTVGAGMNNSENNCSIRLNLMFCSAKTCTYRNKINGIITKKINSLKIIYQYKRKSSKRWKNIKSYRLNSFNHSARIIRVPNSYVRTLIPGMCISNTRKAK
jgi:hypothetical protein